MNEKVKLNFSVDAIKYFDGEKVNSQNLLSFMALTQEPVVILPDGSVYGGAGSPTIRHPLDILTSGADNYLRFNDPVAAKFAQEKDGIYISGVKEKEVPTIRLNTFIECVKRLSKQLPDGKLKQIASQPDFLQDLETELEYLSNVVPMVHTRFPDNLLDHTRAYGIEGQISDAAQNNHSAKKFGHENNKYVITVGLLLEFFGEDHFNVSARHVSADIPVNPLIKGASLNEYGLDCLKVLIEENKDFTDWRKLRTDVAGKLVKNEYKFVTLTMSSPDPFSQNMRTDLGRPANEVKPFSTRELLDKFSSLADKISAGFVKMDEQVQAKIQLDYKSILNL